MTHWRGPEKWEEVVVWRRTLIVSKGWPTGGWGVSWGDGGWVVGHGRARELGYAGEYAGYEALVVLVGCAGCGLLRRCDGDGDGYGGRYRTGSLFLHLRVDLTLREGRAWVFGAWERAPRHAEGDRGQLNAIGSVI